MIKGRPPLGRMGLFTGRVTEKLTNRMDLFTGRVTEKLSHKIGLFAGRVTKKLLHKMDVLTGRMAEKLPHSLQAGLRNGHHTWGIPLQAERRKSYRTGRFKRRCPEPLVQINVS